MVNSSDIWTFKYEPKNFEDMVLDKENRDKLSKIFDNLQNFMLVGPPGVGKGTFAHIFLDKTNADYLWINASDENSIDDMRTKVKSFASALGTSKVKIVIMNECLHEDENIMVGKLDNIDYKSMNELPNIEFDLPSFNMETGEVENDTGIIVSDKIDDVFELELEDGRRIKATKNHPFLINRNDKIYEIKLENLREGDEIITIKMFSKVKSLTYIGKGRVINLNVKKNHTIISKNGIVSHNCDHLTLAAQAMLRDYIEQVQKLTRFILICNYDYKIIPELSSRFPTIRLENPPLKDIAKYVMGILKSENIKVDKIEDIANLIKKLYPDIRKIINTLQLNAVDGKISSVSILDNSLIYDKILKSSLSGDLDEIRKILRSNMINYTELYKHLFENVGEFKSPGDAIIELADASYRDNIVAIKEINLIGCIVKMMKKGCM